MIYSLYKPSIFRRSIHAVYPSSSILKYVQHSRDIATALGDCPPCLGQNFTLLSSSTLQKKVNHLTLRMFRIAEAPTVRKPDSPKATFCRRLLRMI